MIHKNTLLGLLATVLDLKKIYLMTRFRFYHFYQFLVKIIIWLILKVLTGIPYLSTPLCSINNIKVKLPADSLRLSIPYPFTIVSNDSTIILIISDFSVGFPYFFCTCWYSTGPREENQPCTDWGQTSFLEVKTWEMYSLQLSAGPIVRVCFKLCVGTGILF